MVRRATDKEPRYLECQCTGTSEVTGFAITNIMTRLSIRTGRGPAASE